MRRLFFQKPFNYAFFRATIGLIAVNIIVYLLSALSPNIFKYIQAYGSLNVVAVIKYHMYWQFVTYMFIHQNLSHLFFNMLALLMFGIQLEKAIGSKEFLLFYFVCGILSGALSFVTYFFTGYYNVFLIGASGAIYAVLFAYAVVFPRSTIFIWGVLPLPAPLMVGLYALIELGSEFLGKGANVAHLTHLFGFAIAWLYFIVRMKIFPLKIWKNEYKK